MVELIDTNAVVSGTSTVNNNMMRFVPSSDLIPGANYTVTVLGPVTDLAGNVSASTQKTLIKEQLLNLADNGSKMISPKI